MDSHFRVTNTSLWGGREGGRDPNRYANVMSPVGFKLHMNMKVQFRLQTLPLAGWIQPPVPHKSHVHEDTSTLLVYSSMTIANKQTNANANVNANAFDVDPSPSTFVV